MQRSTVPRTSSCLTWISRSRAAAIGLVTLLALGCDRQDSKSPEAASSSETTDGEHPRSECRGRGKRMPPRGPRPPSPGPILDCVAKDNARPICKFQSPEDIVALPGNEALLISGYGAMGATARCASRAGSSSSPSPTRRRRRSTRAAPTRTRPRQAGAIRPAPPPPKEKFNAHGIDLVRRSDGRLALLVVQHFGREAIEFFEVTGRGQGLERRLEGLRPGAAGCIAQ